MFVDSVIDPSALDPSHQQNGASYDVQTVSEAALLQALSGSLATDSDTGDAPQLPRPPTTQPGGGQQEKQVVSDESTAALLSIVNALSSVPGVQSQVLSVGTCIQ